MWKNQTYTIRSSAALILHNGQMADPLNYYSKQMKAVSSKRAKTEADFAEMARIEWYGGLYIANGMICLPGMCIEAAILDAAKKQRKGQQTKAGLYLDGAFPLFYDGPKNPDDLWQDEAFRIVSGVRVQRSRVIRTRPYFKEWGCTFTVSFDDALLNPGDVTSFVRYAGVNVGLCDWRPKYGRFELVEE